MNLKLPLLALLLLAGAAHAGDLFKWTDDKGIVHYSDTPPPANATNTGRVRVQGGVTSDVAPESTESADASKADAPKPKQESPASAPAEPALADAAQDHARACDQARANLDLLQSKYPVGDSSGKPLDSKTRQDMVAQAQQTVSSCN